MTDPNMACPCGSNLTYDTCCKPFHHGKAAPNALLLMRSRYSAFVLKLPNYIVETTHPASPGYSSNKFSWKRKISQFSEHSTFQKLEVLDFKEKEHLATVVFVVHMMQEGEDATFTEKSYFEKFNDRWLYKSGQLSKGNNPAVVSPYDLNLLPLAYYEEKVLRTKAEPILEITEDIKKLAEKMIETMDANDGIGLAAPQIHQSLKLFVIREPIENGDRFTAGDVKVFINPSLSEPSKESWSASEGCLSIPTIRENVTRPKEITVEYQTLEGVKEKQRFTGWAARVIMHENDHLNGVLFIDRLEKEEKERLKPILHNLNNRIHNV